MTQNFSKFPRSDASLKKVPLPPLPFEHHIIDPSKEKPGSNHDLQEALKTIEEFKKKHDEIEKELDDLYQKAGLNPRELQAQLNDPNNFSKEEWDFIQGEYQSLLSSFISKKELEKRGDKLKAALIPSSDTNPSKEIKDRRKKKGARRNWISM